MILIYRDCLIEGIFNFLWIADQLTLFIEFITYNYNKKEENLLYWINYLYFLDDYYIIYLNVCNKNRITKYDKIFDYF